MAKGKDGDNYKKELKNPELLQGQPETRTMPEMAVNPKDEARKKGEKWVETIERNPSKEPQPHREKLIKNRAPIMDHGKDEPEKDK